jgi:hypothetical protein
MALSVFDDFQGKKAFPTKKINIYLAVFARQVLFVKYLLKFPVDRWKTSL